MNPCAKRKYNFIKHRTALGKYFKAKCSRSAMSLKESLVFEKYVSKPDVFL